MNNSAADFQSSEIFFSSELEARLIELGTQNAQAYQTAEPFPHIVLDNFLPEATLDRALADFPAPRTLAWRGYDAKTEKKLEFNCAERLPVSLRSTLYFLNSRPVLRFLEELTGIKGLLGDPYFAGGGLHQIEHGGFLNVHADFNWHEQLQLDRRLNLIIYLNKDWQEEYGGHLELWDRDMTECTERILPVFNRCVVFNTTDFSYHGHPVPLTCPPDRTRRSLAVYYYTNGRPREERSAPHSTIFKDRPSGEPVVPDSLQRKLQKAAVACVPPIIMSAIRKLGTGSQDG